MVYRAKNYVLHFNDKSMDYVTFGKGKKSLVIIPGLGDGLQTVKGMAQMLALTYRELVKVYKVYVFSRINKLPECSHALYEQSKNFQKRVLVFLES